MSSLRFSSVRLPRLAFLPALLHAALIGILLPASSLRAQNDSGTPADAGYPDSSGPSSDTGAMNDSAAAYESEPSDNGAASNNSGPSGANGPVENGGASVNNSSSENGSEPAATEPDEFTQPYSSDMEPSTEPGEEGLERARTLPPGAFGQNPPGLPYSSVIRPTGANVNDVNIMGGHPLRTGELERYNIGNAQGVTDFNTLLPTYHIPFIREAHEPENADIKAGPFFIKFHSLDGLVLYDDNYEQSENDRRSEVLVLLRLNLTVVAQLTENLQFAISGYIGYLPIQNQVGVSSPLYNYLGLLAAGPLLASQAVYDTVIGDWPVRFADDFRAGTARYSGFYEDSFDLFQGDRLDRQQNGDYTFAYHGTSDQANRDNYLGSQNSVPIYFSNTLSALTEHSIPGDIRLTFRLEHQDLWYNQSNRGLPPGRDDFYASAISQRVNQRFKPFLSYEARYVEGTSGVAQIATTGFFGPIDDQLFMRAEVGYFVGANSNSGFLYRFNLNHIAGPYTREYFTADRELDYFDQEVWTSEYYRLEQILGPTLRGTLFLDYATFDQLVTDVVAARTEEIAGAQLSWDMGPRTTLHLGGFVERDENTDGTRYDRFTGRVILDHHLSDTLILQLLYEYQRVLSTSEGNSYYENLVYLRIIKYLE